MKDTKSKLSNWIICDWPETGNHSTLVHKCDKVTSDDPYYWHFVEFLGKDKNWACVVCNSVPPHEIIFAAELAGCYKNPRGVDAG